MKNNQEDNTSNKTEKVVRLLQGYIWYPKTFGQTFNLDHALPERLEPNINLFWDEINPPFTFFDDGTLTETQHFFQFTALIIFTAAQDNERFQPAGLVPWVAEEINERLEQTPAGVGWQILEDLRTL